METLTTVEVNGRSVDVSEFNQEIREKLMQAFLKAEQVAAPQQTETEAASEATDTPNEFIDKIITAQHQERLETLKASGMYRHENPGENVAAPSLARCQELFRSITPAQRQAIKQMQCPHFQLEPVYANDNGNAYAKTLQEYLPMTEQIAAWISDKGKKLLNLAGKKEAANPITGWRIRITEGAQEAPVLQDEIIEETLGNRISWFIYEKVSKGIKAANSKSVILLMQDSLKAGRPINDYWKKDGTYNMVDIEKIAEGLVGVVCWFGGYRQVGLGGNGLGIQGVYARFRSSVVVDVPAA